MTKVTLQDVAAKAGVSTALVSYVLNGQKKDRVSKDATDRILKAVKELDYRPNYLAQSFKRKKTFNIGLIVADIANPFSSQLARIISNQAEAVGYTLTIGSSDENEVKFKKLVDFSLDRQVDGFILAAPEGAEPVLEQLKKRNVPFVLMDRYFPSVIANSVTVENYEAARNAVKAFEQLGRTKLGIIGYKTNLHHLNDRIKGAADALPKTSGVAEHYIRYISEDTMEIEMPAVIGAMLQQGVNAFFFTSNKLGECGLVNLMANNVNVPKDVSLTTFDGTPAFNFYPGSIGYIRQPLTEMGATAFDLLLQQIANPDKYPEQIVLATHLLHTEGLKLPVQI